MSATVVSGVDAPPILETAEHVFDLVALFIEDGVMGDRDPAVGLRGMQAARPRWARAARSQLAS